jgi:FKBP-type peptidyl-prolyl cis-trans isomerase
MAGKAAPILGVKALRKADDSTTSSGPFMKKIHSLALWIASASLFTCMSINAANDPAKTETSNASAAATSIPAPLILTPKQALPKTVDRLVIIDQDIGDKNAESAEKDSAVQVHYTGWLYDPAKPEGKGEKFDASRDQRYPIPIGFFLNAGRVIKGWDLGLVGMKPNGKRTLIIPPSLAYGERVRPKIPANSTLIFDVELIGIVGKRDTTATAPAPTAAAVAATAPAAVSVPAPAALPIAHLTPKDPLPPAPTAITAIDESTGEGRSAETGNDVQVHYTGWLYDASLPGGKGKQFDSSRTRNQLFRFRLGAGRVIKGWDQGVVGMKVKGKRTLIIPAEFGYGARGAGGVIPPNANLIFDIELVELPPA